MLARTTFNSRARGRGGKMKLRSIVWLLTSIFVILTPSVHAQSSSNSTKTQSSSHDRYTASISGTVSDPDGKAVAGARITLLSAMSGFEVTQTNGKGNNKFNEWRWGP